MHLDFLRLAYDQLKHNFWASALPPACHLQIFCCAQALAGRKPSPYAEVSWADPEDFRHLCDRCATSIPDLHRTCAACDRNADGYDLCLHCCAQVRQPGEVHPLPVCMGFFLLCMHPSPSAVFLCKACSLCTRHRRSALSLDTFEIQPWTLLYFLLGPSALRPVEIHAAPHHMQRQSQMNDVHFAL